jgi:hypothetical protein
MFSTSLKHLGHHVHGTDITEAMSELFETQLFDDSPDAELNIETHHFDVIITAERSCLYELDIGKELWLNRSRWSRLTKEYIASDSLRVFIEGAVSILAGEARDGACVSMLFNDPRRYAKKHRWGGCLQAATFRGDLNSSPTLTFYSRTSYIGYMGMMDAAIAYVMARDIANHFDDVDPKDISFRWHLSSAQLHHFKSLPYLYSKPVLLRWIEKEAKRLRKNGNERGENCAPALYHIAKWYNKVLDAWNEYQDPEAMLDAEPYGPFRRIKRRWLEFKGHLTKNIPPSLMPDDLDFSKCAPSDTPLVIESTNDWKTRTTYTDQANAQSTLPLVRSL